MASERERKTRARASQLAYARQQARIVKIAREQQELIDLHEQVICRVDAGESLEEAIEAVTGWGKGPVFNRIRNFALGIR